VVWLVVLVIPALATLLPWPAHLPLDLATLLP
jgi:hypothetical protein